MIQSRRRARFALESFENRIRGAKHNVVPTSSGYGVWLSCRRRKCRRSARLHATRECSRGDPLHQYFLSDVEQLSARERIDAPQVFGATVTREIDHLYLGTNRERIRWQASCAEPGRTGSSNWSALAN